MLAFWQKQKNTEYRQMISFLLCLICTVLFSGHFRDFPGLSLEAVFSHSEYFTRLGKLILLPILEEMLKSDKAMGVSVVIMVDTDYGIERVW